MKTNENLSPTMLEALGRMKVGDGTISRFQGGFWRVEMSSGMWWGASTIEALVRRGLLEYCEYQERRFGSGRFPVKARIVQQAP